MSDALRWAELLDLLGPDDFLRLVEAYGGTRLYVPRTEAGSALPDEIGLDAVRKLQGPRAGEWIRVPLAREWRARHYRANGLSNAKIAVRLGLTETGVNKLFARMDDTPAKGSAPDPRQMTLFG